MSRPLDAAGRAPVDPPQFVDLDRRFASVRDPRPNEDAVSESYSEAIEYFFGAKGWDSLLEEHLVVILGEAGSGKSYEFRHQQARLSAAGKHSFFVRLDEILQRGSVFAGDEEHRFGNWIAGSDEAFFFLDSADEAKLRRSSDLRSALERLSSRLPPTARRRARILLSSRVSGWNHETDGPMVLELLGGTKVVATNRKKADDDDDPAATIEPIKALVVRILPLDQERIEIFAKSRGIQDPKAFLHTIECAHAWEFARRPSDILDLADLWQKENRLGNNLTELLEFSIEQNLRESRDRQKTDILTPARAREGARALAAATILCRRLTFNLPDSEFPNGGLDAAACLPPDWSPAEVRALMERPLFDAASFGVVRFHHRRTSEFLAAEWIRQRMSLGMTLPELERLLFSSDRGSRIIRKSMRPLVAWLCSGTDEWNARVRRWALEAGPEIHFKFGDPGSLPISYKRDVFNALLAPRRGSFYFDSDGAALSRLADDALVPDILAILANGDAPDELKTIVLQVIRYGRLRKASDVLPAVVTDTVASNGVRVTAAAAIRDFHDANLTARLKESVGGLQSLEDALAGVILEALGEVRIEPSYIAALIPKIRRKRGVSAAKEALLDLFRERMSPAEAAELLPLVVGLVQEEPHFPRNRGDVAISQRYAWLRKTLTPLVVKACSQPDLGEVQRDAVVSAILLAETRDEDEPGRGKYPDLRQNASLRHPAVRRSYFIARFHLEESATPGRPPLHVHVFGYGHLELVARDVDWLRELCTAGHEERLRAVALSAWLEAWRYGGGSWLDFWRIRACANDTPTLSPVLWLGFRRRAFRHYYRGRYYLSNVPWKLRLAAHRARGWLKSSYWRVLNRISVRRRLTQIAQGKHAGWLYHLSRQASRENSQYAASDWTRVERRWGQKAAAAGREGCKRMWRTFTPPIPRPEESGGILWGTAIGLSGLLAEHQDGTLEFGSMSEPDCKTAAIYSLHELNGFPPWFNRLAEARPTAVEAIFAPLLGQEWALSSGGERAEPRLFRRLRYDEEPATRVLTDHILRLLSQSDPANSFVLTAAIAALLRSDSDFGGLARLAATRARTSTHAAVWFATWIQLDALTAVRALRSDLESGRLTRPDLEAVVANLSGESGHLPVRKRADFLRFEVIAELYPLLMQYMSPVGDVNRHDCGVYSPDSRDYAQRLRDHLLTPLESCADGSATEIFRQIAHHPVLGERGGWIKFRFHEHLAKVADSTHWNESDVRHFGASNSPSITDPYSLYRAVLQRLEEIRHVVEGGDETPRAAFRSGDRESRLRQLIVRMLNERSLGHFSAVQEPEIDRAERPDVWVVRGVDRIPIEIKKDESVVTLLERLENQLVGQYLRDPKKSFGIFCVGCVDQQFWRHEDRTVGFQEVLEILRSKAADLQSAHERAIELSVVGIDFRPPRRS